MTSTVTGRAAPAAGSRPLVSLIGSGLADAYLASPAYRVEPTATVNDAIAWLEGPGGRAYPGIARRLLELEGEAAVARLAATMAVEDAAAAAGTAPVEADGPFDQWAIVELMGHRRLAGRVREVQIAGAGMLRLDIPAASGRPARTQFVAPASVYALHPADEASARATAAALVAPEPVERWRLTAVPADGPGNDDDDDDAWGGQRD